MQVGSTRRGLDQGIIYSGGLGDSTVQRKGKKNDSREGSQGPGRQAQQNRNLNLSSSSSASTTATNAAAAASAVATAAEMEGLRTRVICPIFSLSSPLLLLDKSHF